MKKLVNELVKLMIEQNVTIALAESITCGLAAHQLNTVKGTSEILIGSVVCYNEKVKTGILNISSDLIKKFTAESQEVTDQLALNLPKLIPAEMYASITGLATSDGSETKSKPVGTVFFTINYKGKLIREKKKFNGTPLEVKKEACKNLYKMVLKELKK